MAKIKDNKPVKVKGSDPYPPTFTVRMGEDNVVPLTDKLQAEKKKRNSPSISNTVETILLEYFKLKK